MNIPHEIVPHEIVPRTGCTKAHSGYAPIIQIAIVVCALGLVGCTSYARMIDGLNARQINSCVEANLSVSTGLLLTGTAHVYTATGGMRVDDCIRHLENRPADWQLAEEGEALRRLEQRIINSPPVVEPGVAQEREAWNTYMRNLVKELLQSKTPVGETNTD